MFFASLFLLSGAVFVPIVLSERTWKRIDRLLNEGERHGVDVPSSRAARGVRWVIVRCDSATAVGVGTDSQRDQLYPATIIYLSSDIDYPPLGEADDTVIGDPCLLTVLGTDGADCPVAVEPIEGRVYAGQLTADVEIDPDVTGLVRARRRVVAPDIYPPLDPAPVTGTGTDNRVARWNGTGVPVIQDSLTSIDDSGNLSTPGSATGATVQITGALVGMNGSTGSPRWAAPALDSDAPPPATVTPPDGTDAPYMWLSDGTFEDAYIIAKEPSATNTGADLWLFPRRKDGVSNYAGRVIVPGRYATWVPGTGLVHTGAGGTHAGLTFMNGIFTGGAFTGGSGTVTSVSGGSTGLTVNDPTTTPTLAGILNLASGGTGSLLTDPAADAFMGWDDSAGATIFFAPDASLAFSGTGVGVGEIDLGTW